MAIERGVITKHPTDMSDAVFQRLSTTVKRPDILADMRTISRNTFGFLVRYVHMVRYYLWIAEQLEDLKPGARILDLGAGLCPVPLWLASRGHRLDCIDNHPIVRTLPPQPDWNIWGFFDYSQVHNDITSIRRGIEDCHGENLYDIAYSIGVLQSMPRSQWEACLYVTKQSLKPGGRLLLCVDIIPGTDFVWNYDGEVEPLSEHRTFRELETCLSVLGYLVEQSSLMRDQNDSLTDPLYIACRV